MDKEDIRVKCPVCGKANEIKSKYCINCGNSLQSIQTTQNQIKCPKCGTLNRPGSSFCAACGKNLSRKHKPQKKKRKFASRLYKDSKGVLKSAYSEGVRKTAKKETEHLLKGIDDLTEGKLSKTMHIPGKYGYLVCNQCHKYYELKKGFKPEDFKVCTCGGKLTFHKSIPQY